MKKKAVDSLLLAALLLTLTACKGPAPAVPASPEPSPSGQPETPDLSSPAPSDSTASPLALEAYRAAMEAIYYDHTYPNGDPVDVPEFAQMENNHFAIFDVDGDGRDELLYENGDATTAGMMTSVFDCMPTADGTKLFFELTGYVGIDFYDNGAAVIFASHNHGLAGNAEFWPHSIYTYDPGQDGYTMAAYIDAWDGVTFPNDFGGTPFPDDVDQDGDKVVYWISYPGEEVTKDWLDGPAYQQWRDGYLGGATRLELPWQNMTEENIKAVAP